ncbi:hypothetical protein ABZS52_30135 [Micromonospora profundi]
MRPSLNRPGPRARSPRCRSHPTWSPDPVEGQVNPPQDIERQIDGGKARRRADLIAAGLPATAWQRRSAGTGSKGPRLYDWACLDEVTTDTDPGDHGKHSLLIRKNYTTGELAFYRCWSPQPVSLATLVRVGGVCGPFRAALMDVVLPHG